MPTAKDVRKLMKEKDIGMNQARNFLVKQELMDKCQEATRFSELQGILLRLINLVL